jgi:type II secretion system protein H
MDRRGFTLMEVVLVLAIMAIVAALTWPALQKPLANRRLHSAADEVRTEWCQARSEAMRSGRTYAFRYEVGGDRFYMQPESGPIVPASRSSAATLNLDTSGAKSGTATGAAGQSDTKSLPKGVRFSGEKSVSVTPAAASTPPQDSPTGGWSEPVLFYPDGTASDVQLVLICNQTYAVRVMLRGTTATATVADADARLE